MRKQILLICVALVAMVGCADSHKLNMTKTDSDVRLTPEHAVYVSLSQDGQYGSHYYAGSGFMVSQAIKAELIVTLNNVITASKPEDYSVALDFARSRKFDYLVYPTILHWEDRATEWSAKADRIKVKMVVVDAKSGLVVKSGIIEGKSGLATFGGDKPQDLLPEPTKEFFASML